MKLKDIEKKYKWWKMFDGIGWVYSTYWRDNTFTKV